MQALLDTNEDASTSEEPMYSKPLLSACSVSKDGYITAMVVGDMLIIYTLESHTGSWKEERVCKLAAGARYLSIAFLRNNAELALGGTKGDVRSRSGGDRFRNQSLQHTPKLIPT